MSTFSGIELVRKSLFAHQKAIDVTGHNIANANTKGFSRQVVVFEAVADNSKGLFVDARANNIGRGVLASEVKQVRFDYYDQMYRKESAIQSELSLKTNSYIYINSILRNGKEDSLDNMLTDLFNSMETLLADVTNMTMREEVKQNAILFTENLNITTKALTSYKDEINQDLVAAAKDINHTAHKIAELNQLIFEFEASGKKANELRDERNLMVDQLSQYMDLTTVEKDSGEYQVLAGGYSLVDHYTVHEIDIRNNLASDATGGTYSQLYWKDTGTKIVLTSGTLKAMTDIRDGNSQDHMGLEYIIDKLNKLAGSVVEAFNTINQQGYTMPYGGEASRTNINFFDPNFTKGIDIRLSKELMESGANIATSDTEILGNLSIANNMNLMNFIELRESSSLVFEGEDIGNLEEYIESIISQVTITTGYAKAREMGQREIMDYVIDQRDSVMGVSLTEETINLEMFQKGYEAAANLMRVLSEMLETLINMV